MIGLLLFLAQVTVLSLLWLGSRSLRRENRRLQAEVAGLRAGSGPEVVITDCFLKGRPGESLVSADGTRLTMKGYLVAPLEEVPADMLRALGFSVKPGWMRS